MLTARATHHRVEVSGARTETSSTYANPNGTWTSEVHAVPFRKRQGGGWVNLDSTLRPGKHMGRLAASGLADVDVNAGGAGSLATLTAGAASLDLLFGDSLPTPVVHGDTATYPNVQPGVDLVARATATGLEQSFVLHQRPSGPLSFRLPLALRNLTARQTADGGIEFRASDGAVLFASRGASMWGAAMIPHADVPAKQAPSWPTPA
jgi:hypothetical protein